MQCGEDYGVCAERRPGIRAGDDAVIWEGAGLWGDAWEYSGVEVLGI